MASQAIKLLQSLPPASSQRRSSIHQSSIGSHAGEWLKPWNWELGKKRLLGGLVAGIYGPESTDNPILNMRYCKFKSHRIHVWYIYLPLVDFYGKCGKIYHTRTEWASGETHVSPWEAVPYHIPFKKSNCWADVFQIGCDLSLEGRSIQWAQKWGPVFGGCISLFKRSNWIIYWSSAQVGVKTSK